MVGYANVSILLPLTIILFIITTGLQKSNDPVEASQQAVFQDLLREHKMAASVAADQAAEWVYDPVNHRWVSETILEAAGIKDCDGRSQGKSASLRCVLPHMMVLCFRL